MQWFSCCVYFCIVFSICNYSALAVSSQCYACHGEYCNDPFNRDRATVMTCSNSQMLVNKRSIERFEGVANVSSRFGDWSSLEMKLKNLFGDLFGTTEYVCAKSLYYNNVHQINMTIRRCIPKNFKGTEACTYLSNIINSGYGRVRTCSFCDTNLCNSGLSLRNSLLTTTLVFSIFKFIF